MTEELYPERTGGVLTAITLICRVWTVLKLNCALPSSTTTWTTRGLVLGVLLVSSIAGVIVHIPAGIGVLEAVFIALLAGEHHTRHLAP